MTEPHPPEMAPAYGPRTGARLPPSRRRRRGPLRWVGLGALGLLALVLLAIVTAVVWLHTGTGARKVASIVVNEARNSIRGRLSLGTIEVRGFLTICADNVDLRDPDGNPALAADRVCAHVNPLALRTNKVLLSDVQLVRPRIDIAALESPDGKPATTLSRALEPRLPPTETKPQSGPFKWVIEVTRLRLTQGSIAIRPALQAPPTFALDGADISAPRVRYASEGADARVSFRAELAAPGKDPIALDLDALLTGPVKTGSAQVRDLRVALGESGFTAHGQYDVGARTGELHLRDLRVLPRDVAVFSREGTSALSGEVRGDADARMQGDSISLAVRLAGGGGRIGLDATVAVGERPAWQAVLSLERVDPERVAAAAPAGEVTGRIEARGQGLPEFDAHGVRGDIALRAHIGPARIERVGEVRVDAEGSVRGRQALVKAFTATGFGLRVSAHGTASFDALALDLDVQAPDLRVVGAAVGALRKQKSLPLSGSAQLAAHVTGAPRAPDARLHLRVPAVRLDDQLAARSLAIDGTLRGALEAPDGNLSVAADAIDVGQIALRSPRIVAVLQWPWAHLRIDSAVAPGRVLLAGDARIDDDKDGLRLANFTVSWPGNELRLARDTRIHLRQGVTVVEPLELVGDHGSLSLAAQLSSKRIDANASVKDFDLSRLPNFALPNLGLYGQLDASLAVTGARSRPDLDLDAQVRSGGLGRTADLPLDAQVRARLRSGRLAAEGFVRGPNRAPDLRFNADLPVQAVVDLSAATPLRADVELHDADLGRLASRLHLENMQRQELQGTVDGRLLASGTLGAPRATLSIAAKGVGTSRVRDVDLRAGIVLDGGRATLDGAVALGGEPTVSLSGQAPFELARALRDRSYLAGALQRPLQADLAVAQLPLERLARARALPDNAKGEVSLSIHLTGTPLAPQIAASARGDGVTSGKLRGLSFQSQLSLDRAFTLNLGAQSNGEPIGHLDAQAAVSGAELVEVARRRATAAIVDPLLDRPISIAVDFPGLLIGRVANLTGRDQSPAEGRLQGRIALTGSAAAPRLQGQLQIHDMERAQNHMGSLDLYVEGNREGALLHLGINPPGGGSFLGHANLVADLGGRTLLRRGFASVAGGELTGDFTAKQLDLAFLSGLAPGVRRAGGTLDAQVSVTGILSKPKPQGKASLRGGQFDVVGQGVFQDVSLNATFSPKEAVVDRLSGTISGGTFSAILVASQRAASQGTAPAIDFTGEIHLGDDESVKGRTVDGKPVQKAPVPLRQAGEERATVQGELDIFGNYVDGLLTLNAKVPDATVRVLQLPNKKLPGLDPNPDVVLVHAGERPHPPGKEPEEVEAELEAQRTAKFRLQAKLDIEHLYVSAEDFEFPVESHLTVEYDARRQPPAPTADGTITVPQGTFTALGRRFIIENAKITETGGELDDPELDIRARFESAKATVNIVISGTAKQPQIDLTSNPPMDQDAIAFFLATGRIEGHATQNGGGVDLSGAASSVLGSLLFGQLRKTLASVLPVDVLTIETQGTGVAQASIGKYIGDRIFIGYRQRLTPTPNENTVEGRLEYEITKSLTAEATIGDITSEVSVLFTYDF